MTEQQQAIKCSKLVQHLCDDHVRDLIPIVDDYISGEDLDMDEVYNIANRASQSARFQHNPDHAKAWANRSVAWSALGSLFSAKEMAIRAATSSGESETCNLLRTITYDT